MQSVKCLLIPIGGGGRCYQVQFEGDTLISTVWRVVVKYNRERVDCVKGEEFVLLNTIAGGVFYLLSATQAGENLLIIIQGGFC